MTMNVYQIVCWRCKKNRSKNGRPLRKITSVDYACEDCMAWGSPTETNVSKKLVYVREEKKTNKKGAGVQTDEAGVSK